MSERWAIGFTIRTRAIENWSIDQFAKSDAIENTMVFKYFTRMDEGRGRELICKCQTKEQAELIVKTHNNLLKRISELEDN